MRKQPLLCGVVMQVGMGLPCGIHEGEQECTQGFDGETCRKETTLKEDLSIDKRIVLK
jgi:hypothetical protein